MSGFATYKNCVRLGLFESINYRGEMFFSVLPTLLTLASIGMLWYVVFKEKPELNVKDIIGYLLVANGVKNLVDAGSMKFGKVIIEGIKEGGLSATLIKPINPLLFMYFKHLGTRGTSIVMSLAMIAAGFMVRPPLNLASCLSFLAVLPVSIIIAYCFCVFSGELAFWTTEANGFRNVILHTIRVFSGAAIPLTYLSPTFKTIILLSPYPALSYLPTAIVRDGLSGETLVCLGASVIWIFLLLAFVYALWRKGLRHYEAIGI